MPERVDLISKSIHDSEYTVAINESHKLKGIAGSFGFPEITDQCHEIEHNLRIKEYDKINEFLDELIVLKNSAINK